MANVQELMNEISQLQKTEEQLYKVLTRNAESVALGKETTMTDSEITSITTQINSLTASRVNLYNALSQYYKQEVVLEKSVKKSIDQQSETLKILERELNKSKQNLAKLEDDKYNQLKMIEINSYFSKQYDAHIKLMRLITIVGLCMLATLLLNYFEPLKVASRPLFNIVLVIGVFLIIKVTIDMYLRRNDNYDEYSWFAAPTTADGVEEANTETNTSFISVDGVNAPFCYGSSCCSTGTVWDDASSSCIINSKLNK
jgi:DNA-binding transcriptional regulator GbsR (MarR family)